MARRRRRTVEVSQEDDRERKRRRYEAAAAREARARSNRATCDAEARAAEIQRMTRERLAQVGGARRRGRRASRGQAMERQPLQDISAALQNRGLVALRSQPIASQQPQAPPMGPQLPALPPSQQFGSQQDTQPSPPPWWHLTPPQPQQQPNPVPAFVPPAAPMPPPAQVPGLPPPWFEPLLLHLAAVQAVNVPQPQLAPAPQPEPPVQPVAANARQTGTTNVARQVAFDPGTIRGPNINARKRHEIGRMTIECVHCGALHWVDERVLSVGSKRLPQFGMCCWHGKVSLPLPEEPPEPLRSLLTDQTAAAREFRQKIRAYNSALQLASSGLAVDERFTGGASSFRVHGAVYHMIGPLRPEDDQRPQFAQLYVHDTDNEVDNRMFVISDLNRDLLQQLQTMLHAHNPFVRHIKAAAAADAPQMRLTINTDGMDRRRYNMPTASEIAAIMPGDGSEDVQPRDIVFYLRGGGVHRISDINAAFQPLHFVLLFPRGELGWQPGIPMNLPQSTAQQPAAGAVNEAAAAEVAAPPEAVAQGQHAGGDPAEELEDPPANAHMDEGAAEIAPEELLEALAKEIQEEDAVLANESLDRGGAGSKRTQITILQFAAFFLHIRARGSSSMFCAGRLFQEWICDIYSMIEQMKLRWIRRNQRTIRAELYQGVRVDIVYIQLIIFSQDALQSGDTDASRVGNRIVLPATFAGSARYMQQLYQDAMAIVRSKGKASLFITHTCNPSWPEIKRELLPGQDSKDRPDLVARVYNIKLKELLDDLTKKSILGRVIGYVYTVEFQKRGLPHAHILLILHPEDRPLTTADYDSIVSAEIPDSALHPELAGTVGKNMMHGPCGALNPNAPCMEDGRCAKGFPKEFCAETTVTEDSYPTYKWPDNGRTVKMGQHELDNRWVVPYNAYLCQKYDCHINVEICATVKAVKYIYKYIFKGHDRAQIEVSGQVG